MAAGCIARQGGAAWGALQSADVSGWKSEAVGLGLGAGWRVRIRVAGGLGAGLALYTSAFDHQFVRLGHPGLSLGSAPKEMPGTGGLQKRPRCTPRG